MIASFDDGDHRDIRVADLMEKYEIPTTFYIPALWWTQWSYREDRVPMSMQMFLYIAENHEIGSHTMTHKLLTKLNPDDLHYEVTQSKKVLEYLTGKKITKFAYPRGYYNAKAEKLVREVYKEARGVKGRDDNGNLLVHIHEKSGANDNYYWRLIAEQAIKDNQPIHLWGHSWELDKFNLWDELEEYIRENTGR